MIVVIQAHPYPDRSRANRALAQSIEELENVETRSLYDLYPDFSIDVDAEQRALAPASVVVWQHPLYWYTAPALLKLWFEKVFTLGWAYGPGGDTLRGKRCQLVVTTGGDTTDYSRTGMHDLPFDAFTPVLRQTAQFCGMIWLEPLVVHAAHRIPTEDLAEFGQRYRRLLTSFGAKEPARHA